MRQLSRRAFLALAAGVVAAVSAPWRVLAHHKPGHGHGPPPKPSPSPTTTTTPPPTTTTPPPTTTTAPPPAGQFGPRLGVQWIKDHAGARPVAAPVVAAVPFVSAKELQSELDEF